MLSGVVKTKLATIDNACEVSARKEVDNFYRNIRYDGSRFLYPSFEEVSNIWLNLVIKKEKEFTGEIKRILDAMASIDDGKLDAIMDCIEDMLRADRYIERLTKVRESVNRKALLHGTSFIPEASRFDLADAAYRVGITNVLRATRANISTELQLYLSTKGKQMNFSSLMTDTVSILKKDGNSFDGIKANVQTGKIFIDTANILIEPGDLIHRTMSNGGEETFEVIDPGFHEKFHGIPASYQMSVKKLGIPDAQKAAQNITYNFAGHNARVNHNSIDNSSNVVEVNQEALEYIAALRNTVQEASLAPHEKQSAGEIIDVIDAQFQSGHPSKQVVSTLLSALPQIENLTTIVTRLLELF